MLPVGTNLDRDRLPIITLTLIGINTSVFLLEAVLPPEALDMVIGLFGVSHSNPNPLSLLTSMFLHGGLAHLVFNMLFLWIFGGPVEERIGSRNFLLYYLGGGIASGLLFIVTELIARPDQPVPAIGASGAISTAIALYLYRCHYSKIRMVISPILMPMKVSIPAIPLILFWFFRDIVFGILSLSVPTGIAHWAHVGGFFFGLAVGRWKRYGQEGQVEHLRMRLHAKLEKHGGWAGAEKELRRLLALSSGEPEVHHDLARLYLDRRDLSSARTHYKASVQRFMLRDPLAAAFTLLEFMEAGLGPAEPHVHLKAADTLIKHGNFDEANQLLKPLVGPNPENNAVVQRLMVLSAKLAWHLGEKENAFEAIRHVLEADPQTQFKAELQSIMKMPAGKVFTQSTAQASGRERSDKTQAPGGEVTGLGIAGFIENVIGDPIFWALLLFVNFAAPFYFGYPFGRLTPIVYFVAAFLMTLIHRLGSISEIFSGPSAASEKKILMELDNKRCFDDAARAERASDFENAADLYEKVLSADPEHVQARFNLARLYHLKLENFQKARRHYNFLTTLLPPDHPYHRDAREAMEAPDTA